MLSDLAIIGPAAPRFDSNKETNKEGAASQPYGEDKEQGVFPSHAAAP
jgi:hypothetical protein